MLELLDNIFKQNDFYEMGKIIGKEFVKKVYTNKFDDMYIVIETELNENTLEELIEISQEIYAADVVGKAKKSNWFMILLVKQEEYITGKPNHMSDKLIKLILNIEENQFYCRKYVLWYTEKEKIFLKDILHQNYKMSNISGILQNYQYFCEFKDDNNIGYELLTRICIKCPFLNLSDIEQKNDSIEDILRKNVNALADGLFDLLVQESNIDILLEQIQLDKSDKGKIEKDIAKLGSDTNE